MPTNFLLSKSVPNPLSTSAITPQSLVTHKQDYPHSEAPSALSSIKFTLKASTATALASAAIGASRAAWRGHNIRTAAFILSMNMIIVSVPFLAVREGFLHYRYFVNEQRGLKNHLVKNKDQMLATTASGVINGALLAYHMRGPWAIIGGSLVYTLFAMSGQFVYSIGRRWRQNQALKRILAPETILVDKWQIILEKKEPISPDKGFAQYPDPLRLAFMYLRDFIKEYIIGTEFPAWASPLVNCMDPAYHEELMLRIEILKAQISILEDEIGTLTIKSSSSSV